LWEDVGRRVSSPNSIVDYQNLDVTPSIKDG